MRFSLHFLPLVILCACGPKDPGDTDDSADSSAGTADATSADTGTASSASTADPPTSGDTPTTGDIACADPSPPLGPPIEIQIRNSGAAVAFVDSELGCENVEPFRILGPDKTALKVDFAPFEWLCSDVMGTDVCGENPGCPYAGAVFQIDPGATLRVPWTGGALVKANLDEACADQFCGGCFVAEPVPAGAYKVQIHHSPAIEECTEPPCTTCQPNDQGWCIVEGIRSEDLVAEATLDLPADTAVEVVLP